MLRIDKTFFRILAVGCALVALTACPNDSSNYVTVPASDGTQPVVGMIVNDSVTNIDTTSLNAPTMMHAQSNTVAVISTGTDTDGGIRRVQLWATTERWHTNADGTATHQGPGLVGAPIKEIVVNAAVGDSVLKNQLLQYNFDMRKELGGWHSLQIVAWTVAENFHGAQAVSPSVRIQYP